MEGIWAGHPMKQHFASPSHTHTHTHQFCSFTKLFTTATPCFFFPSLISYRQIWFPVLWNSCRSVVSRQPIALARGGQRPDDAFLFFLFSLLSPFCISRRQWAAALRRGGETHPARKKKKDSVPLTFMPRAYMVLIHTRIRCVCCNVSRVELSPPFPFTSNVVRSITYMPSCARSQRTDVEQTHLHRSRKAAHKRAFQRFRFPSSFFLFAYFVKLSNVQRSTWTDFTIFFLSCFFFILTLVRSTNICAVNPSGS